MDERFREYEKELVELHTKSYENYDKKLSYLSASSIGFSMVFIKDIVGNLSCCTAKWMLIASWGLLTIVLILNLFSHTHAAKRHNATLAELRSDLMKDYKKEKVDARNKEIDSFNNIINWLFAFGIGFLIVFIFINYKM